LAACRDFDRFRGSSPGEWLARLRKIFIHNHDHQVLVALDERFDREAFSLGRNKRIRQMIDYGRRKTKETGGISLADIVGEIAPQPARKSRMRRQRGKA
jgi:hypothetical protein